MIVKLITKTNENPISVSVSMNETWTAVEHFDAAIATLATAKKWFIERKKQEEGK